jgi:EmrB/QacA subfamily drug resistance transporter
MKKWLTLLVLSLALAIIVIDSSVLNVSISVLIKDLNTDMTGIQWVIAAYSLTVAALTITGGRLGDFFGRKRMFIVGAIIFAIGSTIASFSTNIGMLLFGWSIVEGIGAAFMMPATSSLLITTFTEKKDRAMAFGVFGGIAAASSALGPILGGYLTTNVSWHWAFRINIFVALILVLSSVVISESKDTKEKAKIDWLGVILSSLAMFLIVFGIVKANVYGWWFEKTVFEIVGFQIGAFGLSIVPFSIVLGIITLAVFLWWQNKLENQEGKTPLMSISLFKNKQFTAGTIMTMVLSLGQSGLILAVPIFLQSIRHLSAFDTGVALLPLSAAIFVTAPLSAALSRKISPRLLIQIGLGLSFIASIVFVNTLNVNTTAQNLVPALLLYGAGMGFVMSQTNNFTLSAVPQYQAGEASGVSGTMRQLGSSLGTAIIGSVFTATLISGVAGDIRASEVIPAVAREKMAVEVEKSTVSMGEGSGDVSQAQSPIAVEVNKIFDNSTVEANKASLIVGGGFTILGIATSFLLPNKVKNAPKDTVIAGH